MNESCPCNYLSEPCNDSCTCKNIFSSYGCDNCCSYGSLEQRTEKAHYLNTVQKNFNAIEIIVYLDSNHSASQNMWIDKTLTAKQIRCILDEKFGEWFSYDIT